MGSNLSDRESTNRSRLTIDEQRRKESFDLALKNEVAAIEHVISMRKSMEFSKISQRDSHNQASLDTQ